MIHVTSQDTAFMKRAIELSMKARLISPPNPWVGCVITNNSHIVGEGYTQKTGSSHAEIMALEKAKNQTEGGVVYVTLEPCAHFGRTPPCTEALIKAKIKKVVIGLKDPDFHVCGKGIEQLKSAGIEVVTDVCSDLIAKSLSPYLFHRKTNRPYCVAKAATSVDGKIAAYDGSSQWISSLEARNESHQLRALSQAIIVGANTAKKDLPKLTVRDVVEYPINPPLRVILDSQGSVLPIGPLFDTKIYPTLIFTTEAAPKETITAWKKCGVEVLFVSKANNLQGVDIDAVLNELGKRGVLQVLVEGGGRLISSFIENNALQSLYIDMGPCLLGSQGIPLVQIDSIKSLSQKIQLKLIDTKILGDTVRLHYHVISDRHVDSKIEKEKTKIYC